MEKKYKFLQKYFCNNFEIDFGYLIIIELSSENDAPIGVFLVKIPMAHHFYENSRYYTTSPN